MTLAGWVEGYRRAWESNKPDDIRALFTEDAVYYPEPHAAPWRGHEEIVAKWLEILDDPGLTTFEWSPLTETPELSIVRGRTHYRMPPHTFSNLWVIRFAPDGRSREFIEWWMRDPAA